MNHMPQPQQPSHISPPHGSFLVELLRQVRERLQRYRHEASNRQIGLERYKQQVNSDLGVLMRQGNQNDFQKLQMVGQAIVAGADCTSELQALINRESALEQDILRVLSGLPPVMTVQAQQPAPAQAQWGAPTGQQPAQPQAPLTPEQMQMALGAELLQRIQNAQPMPQVGQVPQSMAPVQVQQQPTAVGGVPIPNLGGNNMAPQTVTQVPTPQVPGQGAQVPTPQVPGQGAQVTMTQQPTPPAIAAANQAAMGTTPGPNGAAS